MVLFAAALLMLMLNSDRIDVTTPREPRLLGKTSQMRNPSNGPLAHDMCTPSGFTLDLARSCACWVRSSRPADSLY